MLQLQKHHDQQKKVLKCIEHDKTHHHEMKLAQTDHEPPPKKTSSNLSCLFFNGAPNSPTPQPLNSRLARFHGDTELRISIPRQHGRFGLRAPTAHEQIERPLLPAIVLRRKSNGGFNPLKPCFFGGNGPIHWRTTCAQAYVGAIFCESNLEKIMRKSKF